MDAKTIEAYKEAMENRNSDKTVYEKYGELPLEKLADFTFKNGKMKGKTFGFVVQNESSYVIWIIDNIESLSKRSTAYLFAKYVERLTGTFDNKYEIEHKALDIALDQLHDEKELIKRGAARAKKIMKKA